MRSFSGIELASIRNSVVFPVPVPPLISSVLPLRICSAKRSAIACVSVPRAIRSSTRVIAAGEFPYCNCRGGTHERRNPRRNPASVRKLRMESRVVFVEPFAELVGDDFEAGAELAGVEGNGRFLAQSSFALARPRRIRIAHDFANVFVEQQRLDGPKEWKDQFKAHSGNLTAMEAQRVAGLPRVKIKDLCGRFLLGHFIVILIFRGGLFGAIQLQDRSDPNFPDAPFGVRLLALVLPAAQLAFHLDMRALGERLGELRELAEDDATMPFGVRDVLAILLVGGLGCQREVCDAEVRAVAASFWVAAEKADEGYFVLVHSRVS